VSGRNAEGREVREYIAIGANGGPVSVQAYAPPLVSLGNLPMAGLISTEGNSKASPTVVTFLQPHGLVTGDTVYFTLSDSLPIIDGPQVVTVIDSVSFSVPVNTSNTNSAAVIDGISLASPSVVDTVANHGIVNGATVVISGTDSVPTIDGSRAATVAADPDQFTVAVDLTANQTFTISSITKASPAIVTTTTPHLLKAGSTNLLIEGTDSVPVINDAARAATYIDATTFSVAVDIPTGQTFTIATISAAAAAVVTVAAGHLLKAGTTSVTIAGTNSTPVIDGVRVATYIDATTFSVPVTTSGTGSAGTVNYGRAGTTGTAKYKRAGTTGLVSYGHAGTTTTQMQPAIIGISLGTYPVITTGQAHGLRTGDTVTTSSTDSTPAVDDTYTVTVLSDRTFTIPAAAEVTVVGTTGKLVKVTYNSSVLDRGGATGGGAVVVTTSLGHATGNTIKLNIQGSADGVNWWNIPYALVATPRTFVTTEITRTTGAAVTYLLQELVYWRYLRVACNTSRNLGVSVTATYVAYP
jgi:hypothetical protein